MNSNFDFKIWMWKICHFMLFAVVSLSTCVQQTVAQNRDFEPLQRSVKVLSTNLSGFGIPFKVSDDNGRFIEVQLYLSKDQGKTWTFESRQPPSKNEFAFVADGDGEYWFAIKTLDRNRRLLPDGNAQAELKIIVDTQKPKLDVEVQADAAGRVVCRWQAADSDLDIDSFRIEYRGAGSKWQTVPVQLTNKLRSQTWTEQLAWWPDTAEQDLEIRFQIADKAGNAISANRRIATKPTAWRKRSSGSTFDRSNGAFPPVSQNPVVEVNRNDGVTWKSKLKPIVNEQPTPGVEPKATIQPASSRWRINESVQQRQPQSAPQRSILPPGVEVAAPPRPAGVPEDLVYLPPPPKDDPLPNNVLLRKPAREPWQTTSNGSVEWESEVRNRESIERSFSSTTNSPQPSLAPTAEPPRRSTDSIVSNPSTKVRQGKNFVTESTTSWPDNQWNGPTAPKVNPDSELAPRAPRKMVAINRLSNQPSPPSNFSPVGFRKLPKVPQPQAGPPSSDFNTTSDKMPESANTQIISTKRFRLNYDIDAIDPSGVDRVDLWMTRDRGRTWKLWGQDPDNVSPFPVEVVEEGIYGFKIVVRSKDGLAGRGPTRGQEADMWVQVDVSAPLVKITSVPYGKGREVGHLVINYAVSDSNLSLRPNAIHWSTNPEGPWTAIEEDLRNDGRYVWKPSQNVPHRIFLRLQGVDRAGNAGVHLLEQAIDLSGLTPRGTIFGVEPVGR